MKARRLLIKGCQGYLAHVIDTRVHSEDVQQILVVKEFMDIFLAEFFGLPPKKKVEFSIELTSGTSPISMAPYHMALAELKELKVQLQDLLDKGFTKLSTSPWGAPVLFVKRG